MKILNLYAGIGGNRQGWYGDITAVEHDPRIAALYAERFPDDDIIVGDAHQYLEDHYKEYDFIWSSPPCPTHSKLVKSNMGRDYKMRFPDMRLYQEIIFLENFHKGRWLVENVIPYYEPLVRPDMKLGRHLAWCNFYIPEYRAIRRHREISYMDIKELEAYHNWKADRHDLTGYEYRRALRNAIEPGLGAHVFSALSSGARQTQLV